jgi:uncharacterized metal-binding protein
MSSFDGQLHEKDTRRVSRLLRILSVPVAISAVALGWGMALAALGLWFGSIMGWWLSPDLDHTAVTRSEYQAMKKGCFGFAWVAFWTPYAIIPHRSFLSHSFVGTVGRVVIFLGCFIHVPLLALYNAVLTPEAGIEFSTPWALYVGFAIACAVHDGAHYVRDGLDPLGILSLFKRRRWK